MNRNRTLLGLGITFAALALIASVSAADPRGAKWTKISEKDGITTYKREIADRAIVDLLGIGIVNAPIVRVACVLLDFRRAKEWIDRLEESRVIRWLGPLEYIEYTHISTPPVVLKDRDFVTRSKIVLNQREQTLILRKSPAADPAAPPTQYVRGEAQGYWKLKSIEGGRKTLVVVEMHADPKGSVAKWLVNAFQTGWPRNTIESLRAQVAKPDIKISPEIKAAFEGKPFTLAKK